MFDISSSRCHSFVRSVLCHFLVILTYFLWGLFCFLVSILVCQLSHEEKRVDWLAYCVLALCIHSFVHVKFYSYDIASVSEITPCNKTD